MSSVEAWVLPAAEPVDQRCLRPAERAHAGAMGSAAAAARHLRGRAALRHVAAARNGHAPHAVPLTTTAAGHPVVAAPGGPWVSVSHSGDLVAVAACADAPVGIDVEATDARHRTVPSAIATSERLDAVAHLAPEALRPLAVWVVLEAALKAAGTGFAQEYRTARWFPAAGGVLVDLPVGGRHGCRLRFDATGLAAVGLRGRAVPTVAWHEQLPLAAASEQQPAGEPALAEH